MQYLPRVAKTCYGFFYLLDFEEFDLLLKPNFYCLTSSVCICLRILVLAT